MSRRATSWIWILGCFVGAAALFSVAGACNPTQVPVEPITMSDVVGAQLDHAVEHLESLGLTVKAQDSLKDRSILMRRNWYVTDQDPAPGQQVNVGDEVKLGVQKHTDTSVPTDADEEMAEDAVEDAATPSTTVTTAADSTTSITTVETVPTTLLPSTTTTIEHAEPEIRYKNCAEARAAGVTPIREGEPGYARHLDGDGDGVACE